MKGLRRQMVGQNWDFVHSLYHCTKLVLGIGDGMIWFATYTTFIVHSSIKRALLICLLT